MLKTNLVIKLLDNSNLIIVTNKNDKVDIINMNNKKIQKFAKSQKF